MKRGTLIIVVITVSCFFAGFILAEYNRSHKQVENLPSTQQIVTEDLTGKPSPGFSLMDVSGQLRNVSEWQGKVLVINFWATWCPPCLEEIPHFINLQDKYGDQGLQFLGIALEDVDDVTSFANKLGINYPLLVGEQEVIKLAGKFGNRIGGLPYTVVLDRTGIINFIKIGPLSVSEAEHVITSLL
jgi:thiol-disulfide isomerase/thioredoxin